MSPLCARSADSTITARPAIAAFRPFLSGEHSWQAHQGESDHASAERARDVAAGGKRSKVPARKDYKRRVDTSSARLIEPGERPVTRLKARLNAASLE